MKRAVTLLSFLVLYAFAFVCCARESNGLSPQATPEQGRAALTILAAFSNPPEAVFDTKDACEQIDIPDQSARAFRDNRGIVHLIASHFVVRARTGSSLNSVKRDCHVVYRASEDRDPSHFQYENWLVSFYTLDGSRIAALVHSEFHGWEIPGMCATPTIQVNCWWNTITFAQSTDGGHVFAEPKPPLNLVASLPYRYVVGNRTGAYGYYQPTNIVNEGNFFYAMINNLSPHNSQKYGSCLIRTNNIFDPSSWRAWNGSAFATRFVDPYMEADVTPEDHVCEPVLPGIAESLVRLQGKGDFIVSVFTPDDRFGPPGLYLIASRDLIHWSKPALIETTRDLAMERGPGKWTFQYSSILDPNARDRNFSTVTDAPFIYYVISDEDHPPYARVLYRRRIKLQING